MSSCCPISGSFSSKDSSFNTFASKSGTVCKLCVSDLVVSNTITIPGGDSFLLQVTGDVGIAVPDTTGNLNLPGAGGILTTATGPNTMRVADRRNLSPYVVGPDPIDSEYQSIQAAMDQAVLDGATNANPAAIMIKNSNYVENLVIPPGVRLMGLDNLLRAPQITGTVTITAVANLDFYSFSNLLFSSAAAVTFDVVTGSGVVGVIQMNYVFIENTGVGTGFRNSGFNTLLINNSRFLANTGIACHITALDNVQDFFHCDFLSFGGESFRSENGPELRIVSCKFFSGIVNFVDGGGSFIRDCEFLDGIVNFSDIGVVGVSGYRVDNCHFQEGTTFTRTVSGGIQFSHCVWSRTGSLSVTTLFNNSFIHLSACSFYNVPLTFAGDGYNIICANNYIQPDLVTSFGVNITATNLNYNEWANNNMVNGSSGAADSCMQITDTVSCTATYLTNNSLSTRFGAASAGAAVTNITPINSGGNFIIGWAVGTSSGNVGLTSF